MQLKYSVLICFAFSCISTLAQQKSIFWKEAMACETPDSNWVNKVDELVGPNYVLLKYKRAFYKETNLSTQRQYVIVAVSDTLNVDVIPKNKIFLFAIRDDKLQIIDSSAEYVLDGHGPQISLKEDSLYIKHPHAHGGTESVYIFDKQNYKFKLAEVNSYETYPHGDSAKVLLAHYDQYYEIDKGVLKIKKITEDFNSHKVLKSNEQIIQKSEPADLSVSLSKMKDPEEYYALFEN